MSGVYEGYALIDKPAGMTSHDVVAAVRKALRERRVGHAGTLDPDATGVLLVGIGRATRLLRFVGSLTKSYRCEIVLGTSTSTLDASGAVTGTFDMGDVTIDDVQREANKLIGDIEQLPPMVSAVKVGGQRLYKLANTGVEVERELRPVTVTTFDIAPTHESGVFGCFVVCSSGTYVRTLAADVGTALGGGAHLRALRRTAIGPFVDADATPLAEFDGSHVAPAKGLVAHLESAVVDAARKADIGQGKVMLRDELACTGPGPWALYDRDGELLAIYEAWRSGKIKPAMVLMDQRDPVVPDDSIIGPR